MRCRLIDETLLYVKMRVLNNVQVISMLGYLIIFVC